MLTEDGSFPLQILSLFIALISVLLSAALNGNQLATLTKFNSRLR